MITMLYLCVFFFKQKTAYEMRISDWSSDVCSSDLRVSPMELTITDGRIYVGSMPNAVKAKDLQRDPRCCIITALADKDDLAGEVKLFCVAREIAAEAEWERIRAHFKELNGVDVGRPGDSHMYELGIEAVAWARGAGAGRRTTPGGAGGPSRG